MLCPKCHRLLGDYREYKGKLYCPLCYVKIQKTITLNKQKEREAKKQASLIRWTWQ